MLLFSNFLISLFETYGRLLILIAIALVSWSQFLMMSSLYHFVFKSFDPILKTLFYAVLVFFSIVRIFFQIVWIFFQIVGIFFWIVCVLLHCIILEVIWTVFYFVRIGCNFFLKFVIIGFFFLINSIDPLSIILMSFWKYTHSLFSFFFLIWGILLF